jgi:predicted fused transcriptional regulator/phosphomethylpyrimidine kinase
MMDEEIEMYGRMAVALNILEGCQEFAAMIPEVRTNLVYARPGAKTRYDVLGIDGRITVVNGLPHAAGKPRFGASSHMARLIVEMGKIDASVRAGIDFANDPRLAKWLEEYCQAKGWTFSCIDRRHEPEEIKEAEGASMPWKAREAIRAAGGKVPRIFYETGAVGKEPVSVLVGRDPIEVAEEMGKIARAYHAREQDRKD